MGERRPLGAGFGVGLGRPGHKKHSNGGPNTKKDGSGRALEIKKCFGRAWAVGSKKWGGARPSGVSKSTQNEGPNAEKNKSEACIPNKNCFEIINSSLKTSFIIHWRGQTAQGFKWQRLGNQYGHCKALAAEAGRHCRRRGWVGRLGAKSRADAPRDVAY